MTEHPGELSNAATARAMPGGAPLLAGAARTRRDTILRRFLGTADVTAVAIALGVARLMRMPSGEIPAQLRWGLLTLPGWLLLFKAYGLYSRDAKRVSHSTVDDVPWLFHAVVIGSGGLWFYYKLIVHQHLILRQGVAFFCVAFAGVFAARALARWGARLLLPPERVLFVGGGADAQLLVQKIRAHPEYALFPIGYVDETERKSLLGLPYLGDLSMVESLCRGARVERVLVVAPSVDSDTTVELIRRTKDLDVKLSILPEVVDVLGRAVEIDDVEGVTLLGLNPPVLTRSSRSLKRTMDVAIASTALVLTLPLMFAIAIGVKSTSPGPVLYPSPRIGRNGRRFNMLKFRTMVEDAGSRVDELRTLSMHPAWLLLDDDPRVTPFGRFLRHTSLDELPQLVNVVSGSMSLVGPRPMPPYVDEQIEGWGRRRLDLTPGITGLWQVLGRTDIPFEEMIKLDYLYVTNWSLWQDVRLLIHTLPAVLRRRGVN